MTIKYFSMAFLLIIAACIGGFSCSGDAADGGRDAASSSGGSSDAASSSGGTANGGTHSAGAGGTANGGTHSAGAGGTANGGTHSAGGSGGAKSDCPPTCFRGVSCVVNCGDVAVDYGCCPCPDGMTDTIYCVKN